MRAIIGCGVLVAALVTGALPASADTRNTVVNGDIIRSDTTWGSASGPYIITRAVQIAPGATLTIGPGVQIQGRGTEHLFKVGGTLKVAGTAASPVDIDGGRSASVLSIPTTADAARVEIGFARIHNGKAIMPAPVGDYITLRITDSVIERMPEYNHLWYVQQGSLIARNTFSHSGGFSVGIDSRTSEVAALSIESNRFRTASTTGYWVENWAAYGEPLRVVGNAFEAAGEPAVALSKGYTSTQINASGNYWGTTDRTIIDSMVLDGLDDIEYASIIPIDPILTSEPANLPPAPPRAPTNVAGEALDGGQVSVTWSAPAGLGSAKGILYRVTASPGGRTCQATDALSCTVDGLTVGSAYTFTVTATNSAGTSNSSIPTSAVMVTTTQGKSASRVTDGRISASIEGRWVAPTGCGSYLVRYSGLVPADIGSIDLLDAASGKQIASETFITPDLSSGVLSYQVCSSQVAGVRDFRLALDFDDDAVLGGSFTWQSSPPPIGKPTPLPGRVTLGSISVSTTGIWTRPSSGCGNYLFTYSGITDRDIGSVKLLDPMTRDILASETFLSTVENGLGNVQVCSSDVRPGQPLLWQADFAGYSVAEGEIFAWQSSAPKPPNPSGLPAVVSLGPITVSTTGAWTYPTTCNEVTFDYVGWDPEIIGSVTLIEATTRRVISSEVFLQEPASGTGKLQVCRSQVTPSSRFLLQIDASGYGTVEGPVFTWEGSTGTIIITGSRASVKGMPGIQIRGSASGLPTGTRLAPRIKVGSARFVTLPANITVRADQTFTWQRATSKRTSVIVQTQDGAVQSNSVTINPR